MCYEEGLLRRWAKKRMQRREEPKSVVERVTPTTLPDRSAAIPTEGKKRKEVERELESV